MGLDGLMSSMSIHFRDLIVFWIYLAILLLLFSFGMLVAGARKWLVFRAELSLVRESLLNADG
jgi:hypothetical protein